VYLRKVIMNIRKRLPKPTLQVDPVAMQNGAPSGELQAALGTTLSPYAAAYYQQNQTSVPISQKDRRTLYKKIAKRIALTLLVLAIITGGWLGWKFVVNTGKVFGGNIFGLLHPTKLSGEDVGRVNILLAGNSADDPGHGGASLTDSIMIVSIDTRNNTAFLLSIPRDLWVNVSGNGYEKINEAYVDGQANHFSASGYPNGGMGQLEQVVSTDLGIPINYYALVNYTAFRDTVNAVGGVDVTIQSSDPRGLYDPNIAIADGGPLKMGNGLQHLNGQQALNLARARGDSYRSYGFPASDFDRTTHQRQLLVALKSKIGSASTLSNPIKVSSLLDAVGKNITTDFNTGEASRLYQITQKINNSKITSVSLNNYQGKNYLASYTGSGGQSALIPAAGKSNYSAIQQLLDTLTVVPTPTSGN
jgi:polyisoprenyl-teichoic acid--peptidoglycan teichoic acid transferase